LQKELIYYQVGLVQAGNGAVNEEDSLPGNTETEHYEVPEALLKVSQTQCISLLIYCIVANTKHLLPSGKVPTKKLGILTSSLS
jgi:hypothetical protein